MCKELFGFYESTELELKPQVIELRYQEKLFL